jgi:hypothetical protein
VELVSWGQRSGWRGYVLAGMKMPWRRSAKYVRQRFRTSGALAVRAAILAVNGYERGARDDARIWELNIFCRKSEPLSPRCPVVRDFLVTL